MILKVKRKLHGKLNITKDDDVYLSYDAKPPKGLILSLAAGMGNIYSAAILEAI